MATAAELMNPTLVALHEDEPVGFALDYLRQMGLHAAPVLDSDRRPVGVATLADLAGHGVAERVGAVCGGAVLGVDATSTLEEMAELAVDTGLHHLVVTAEGRVVGMISVIDLLSGMLGRRPSHVPMLQVFAGTVETDADWSPSDWLTASNVESVPAIPGFVLIRAGGTTEPVRLIRAARTHDMRLALKEFLEDPPEVAVWSDHWGPFRFQWCGIRP